MPLRRETHKFVYQRVKKAASRYIVNELPKTYNDVVYPKIPFLIRSKPWKIKNKVDKSASGRLNAFTFNLTDLFRDERVVLGYNKATELRPYVERLIVEAMRHGDRHRPTMELANYWLREKNLVHKLFKVFVPRYQDYNTAFTALHVLGIDYSIAGLSHKDVLAGKGYTSDRGQAILEMRGNELPPIIRPRVNNSGFLTNILLAGARERYSGHSTIYTRAIVDRQDQLKGE